MFSESPSGQFKMPKLASENRQKWSYGALLFSIFYFAPLLSSMAFSSLQVAYMALFYIAFLTAHIFAINSDLKVLPILLLVVIVVSSSFITLGAYALFGYPLFILGYQYRYKKSAFFALCIVAIAFVIHQFYWQGVWFLFIQFLFISTGLYIFGCMERKETLHQLAQNQSNDEIKQLSSIAERERIGRDLHDIVGHALSSISLKAQVAAKMIEKERYQTAKDEVLALAELSQNLLSEIRKTVSNIKQLTLSDELEKLFDLLRSKDIVVNKNINTSAVKQLNPLQETQLSLIFKEAITNVLRHTKATLVNISVQLSDGERSLSILISNDGINGSKYISGNGLQGIKERISNLNGTVDISMSAQFRIFITLPINTDNK